MEMQHDVTADHPVPRDRALWSIIGGVFLGGTGAVIFFGLLKTGADVVMHKVEYARYRAAR